MSCLMLTDTIKQVIYSYANTNTADQQKLSKINETFVQKVRGPGGL